MSETSAAAASAAGSWEALRPPLRDGAFVAIYLLLCVTLAPFQSLSTSASIELTSGGDTMSFVALLLLAGGAAALVWPQLRLALVQLGTPSFIVLAAWLAVCSVVSEDASTSVRRLALAAAMALAGLVLFLLPATPERLARLLAIGAAVVLLLSYGGILLVPDLAIHQLTDAGEPDLAGKWRGVFAHKNDASGVMSMFMFQGLFIARRWSQAAGWAIVAASLVFLVFAGGKSSGGFVVLALGLGAIATRWSGRVLGLLAVLLPVLVINALGVGSVLLEPLGRLTHALPIDPTFTGRDAIWSFALDSLPGHLLTGHGFDAFWNTASTRFGGEDDTDWAGTASHAHNSYLDAVMNAGLPGLVLVLLAFVRQPMRDLDAARERGVDPALLALLVQTWLFGLMLSGFETIFFHRRDPIWLFFLFALFGLRCAATLPLKGSRTSLAGAAP